MHLPYEFGKVLVIEQLRINIFKNIASENDTLLSNCFSKKQVLKDTFREIWRIQIQIYLKTYVELKYGACYLKN